MAAHTAPAGRSLEIFTLAYLGWLDGCPVGTKAPGVRAATSARTHKLARPRRLMWTDTIGYPS
jgi:hypothetical protein